MMTDDKKIKVLMKDSELAPSENLRYRIMQQIEMEKALKPKKVKSNKPIFTLAIGVAATIYLLVVAIGIVAVVMGGFSALASVNFVVPVLIVVFCGCMYLLISLLDERRYKS